MGLGKDAELSGSCRVLGYGQGGTDRSLGLQRWMGKILGQQIKV